MIKHLKRFNMPAIAAMGATICFLALMNFSLASTGFTSSRGIPFKWYTWTDLNAKETYIWWAVPVNIFIGLAAAIAVGLLVEKLTPKPPEPLKNKAQLLQ